ncbi:MAG: hypothetical protein DLM54_01855 [Acidimicrobiales bacterium]|nr:MAG: hypothetical protein DLM54_01855 [Acidimicrobiales bacterium]
MTVSVYESLAQELEKDPAKRQALRALLLTEELLTLPATVAALAADVKELAQLMRQAWIRLDRLEADVGVLKGSDLERRWQRNLPSYLGRHFRRLRVLDRPDLRAILEDAIDAGRIDDDEADDAALADVVGRGRRVQDGSEAYVVVEVSVVVDAHDVDRASRRAAILSRATGESVQAVAGGRRATRGASEKEAATPTVLLVAGTRETA